MDEQQIQRLVQLNHGHVWHPFTPMKQWRQTEPMIIEAAEGDWLIDARGNRYIDGVSSIWCNVHGHRVPEVDQAIRDQLDKVAHTTMLGLVSVPATELAARLAELAPGGLNKTFYSDAGATATELAFKMAVGYWHHRGRPQRDTLVALTNAYHGDTTGSMSVGYSELMHRPFKRMVFHTEFVTAPDVFHAEPLSHDDPANRKWSLEQAERCERLKEHSLEELDRKLTEKADRVAGVVVEPLVQGAAGLVMQPPGYLKGVEELCKKHETLLVTDEVATGFGRTGRMFAVEHEDVEPDIMALGKGISAGYLPLAATMATDDVEGAFCGEIEEHKTLYHGHTYTGNPLACAAALASLDLFEKNDLIHEVQRKADRLARKLDVLRDGKKFPAVVDVRQRGLMTGIELSPDGSVGRGYDPSRRMGKEVCDACRADEMIIRPLGNVAILMPPLGIRDENLDHMADSVIKRIEEAQQKAGL